MITSTYFPRTGDVKDWALAFAQNLEKSMKAEGETYVSPDDAVTTEVAVKADDILEVKENG